MVAPITSKRSNTHVDHNLIIGVTLKAIDACALIRQLMFVGPRPATRMSVATHIDERVWFDDPPKAEREIEWEA